MNMEVRILDMPLDGFVNFISDLKRASISWKNPSLGHQPKDMGSFKHFTYEISSMINRELFNEVNALEPFPTHTSVFIEETDREISDSAWSHRRAIAAAMKGLTFANASGISKLVIDEYLQNRMRTFRHQEALFFTPTGSFFSASPDWDVEVPNYHGLEKHRAKKRKLSRKIKCMRTNYHSCLNVLFAVNRVLSNSVFHDEKVPPEKLEELKRCFGEAFPEDNTKIYFKHVFEKVAPALNLEDRLNGFR
jgi:hypothetical protein